MTSRFSVAVVLSGLILISGGCTNSGNTPPLTSTGRTLTDAGRERVRIRQFADLPQYGSSVNAPTAITAGPGGLLWVTDVIDYGSGDFISSVVVAIARSGAQKHTYFYNGPGSVGASFNDIVEGPDRALWITDTWNEQILKFTQGSYTGFVLPNLSAPLGICSGPDQALWFTVDSSPAGVGRITTSGQIKLFNITGLANDIAAGPDGALWFTQPQNDQVGRITTSGKVTEYSKGITAGSEPYSIAPGPDGALWFTERTGSRIGRITTAGKVTEYSSGITPSEQPFDLVAGPDGAMWFTEYEIISYYATASKVGRITMRGKIDEYQQGLSPGAAPTTITAGPDKRMWFVENYINQTGRITLER